MKHSIIGHHIRTLVLFFLLALLFMVLWNYIMTAVFALPPIKYLQAVGLLLMTRIALFTISDHGSGNNLRKAWQSRWPGHHDHFSEHHGPFPGHHGRWPGHKSGPHQFGGDRHRPVSPQSSEESTGEENNFDDGHQSPPWWNRRGSNYQGYGRGWNHSKGQGAAHDVTVQVDKVQADMVQADRDLDDKVQDDKVQVDKVQADRDLDDKVQDDKPQADKV
ncbi:MAG: hypothetical protein LBT62_04585 [Deltaproteobacteria bacterium]|nr:hypothetical protein [Deltaproteobacteria bacterium]